MALYSYITDECLSDAQKLNLEEDVKKYATKIESDQSLGSVALYPHPFIKRNVRRQGRLIMEERRLEDDVIYCFLKVFKRSDEDYKTFMKQSHTGGLENYIGRYIPSDTTVLTSLQSRRDGDCPDPHPFISVPEHAYLNCIAAQSDMADESIIESRTWVERMSNEKMKPFRVRYGDLLDQLVFSKQHDASQTVANHTSHPQFSILYRYFPQRGIWFLIAPLDIEAPVKDEAALRRQYDSIFNPKEATLDMVLRKEGLRSYPSLVTAQSDLWLSTQETTEANLALSPEEMDVLNSVLKPGLQGRDEREMYPLFINGRPGSGKSTILLYLFAEHLHFHLNQVWIRKTNADAWVLDEPPLYLTYSESLLNDARRIAHNILRCDSEKAQAPYDLQEEEIKHIIDESFGHFRTFLRNKLPATTQDRFPSDKYIDFPRFQRILKERLAHQDRAEVRELSPEIAWHVIRTYIKGMRQEADEYIDSEYYEYEVPRKQRSVSLDTFQMVYDIAWKGIYQPMCNEGFWDDQDLARQLLDLDDTRDINLSRHVAIFCDESQDFTKLELELVFRLSLFARRNIKKNNVQEILHRIPFAFAGDPFQTLNPTGFDWDATKSIFHENIIRPLDPGDLGKLKLNVKELEYNYRSAAPIVQFCNLIQLLRARTFEDNEPAPQKTWQSTAALKPAYFDIAQPICRQELTDSEAALVIIVPCQEGEEATYVREDPFLSTIAWNEEDQTITRDILSPMRAKGLQFKRIVLYKFGSHALEKYQEYLHLFFDHQKQTTSRDATLPLEYFINHLYVAVSRPRGQLIIVDTQEALEQFWAFASREHLESLVSTFEPDNTWSPEDVTHIIPGPQEVWRENLDDARQLGDDFFQMGKSKSDPYFMERAFRNYSIAGLPAKAIEAMAYKNVFEDKPKEAGREFVKLNRIDEAMIYFWRDNAFEDIHELTKGHAYIAESMQGRIATYMVNEPRIENSIRLLLAIKHHVKSFGDRSTSDLDTSIYTRVMVRIITHLAKVAPNKKNTPLEHHANWIKIWKSISDIAQSGIQTNPSTGLARLAFEADAFNASKRILEACKTRLNGAPDWMVQVFVKSSTYPETLRWLQQFDLNRATIETYEQHRKTKLDEAYISLVFDAYLKEHAYKRACIFLNAYPSEEGYLSLLDALDDESDSTLGGKVILDLLDYYVLVERWDKAVDLTSMVSSEIQEARDKEASSPSSLIPEEIHARLIRKLARSEPLKKERSRTRLKKVSKYLQKQLVPPTEALAHHVHPHEAGAAFERTNEFEDILAFYESVIQNAKGVNAELQQWAELRWIKNKFKYTRYFNNKAQRSKVVQDARSLMTSLQLTNDEARQISELPEVGPIANAPEFVDGFGVDPNKEEPAELPKEPVVVLTPQKEITKPTPPPSEHTPKPSTTEHKGATDSTSIERTDDAPKIQQVPILETPQIQSIPTPTIVTSSSSRYSRQRINEVPIAVSIMLQVGDMTFDCELLEQLRVLDLREQHTKTRVAVLADRREVRDSYDKLNIIPRENARERQRAAWLIDEWFLEIGIESRGPVANISLVHTQTNRTVLNLQI